MVEGVLQGERHGLDILRQLAAIVASSDEAIIGKDIRGTITGWSRGAEEMFGYTADEMIGRSIRCLLPPGADGEEEAILRQLRNREVVQVSDAVRVTKGGRHIHASLSIAPVVDADGRVVGAAKIARDLTDKTKLMRQLQQSQKMEAIGQLTGGVAHDFNNLLTIIVSSLDLQREFLEGNPGALESWKLAHGAALRGADLTRRLLGFASVQQVTATPLSLDASIRNVADLLRHALGPAIALSIFVEPGLEPVLADPVDLENALLNLAINARDAMRNGGEVSISVKRCVVGDDFVSEAGNDCKPGNYACIAVKDSGTGMPPEVVDRAFEPFFTTKERHRGTGLGLSMAYGFAKRSQGCIRICSALEKGTEVTLFLPLAQWPVANVESVRHEESSGVGIHVLMVDDEAGILAASVSYLRRLGYTAFAATDGADALALLATGISVDVMVTDIVMGGGMDGLELAQEVHQAYPAIRIVYSSGFAVGAHCGKTMPVAGSLMLRKPYRLSELGDDGCARRDAGDGAAGVTQSGGPDRRAFRGASADRLCAATRKFIGLPKKMWLRRGLR